MPRVARQLPQPDRNRLSVLSALVLLSYTLLRIVELPAPRAEFTVLGLLLRFEINTSNVILTLAAALTAAGADWLIGAHPWREKGRSTREHWVMPSLAALGVGAILARLPMGPAWWMGLGLSAALVIAILATEFVVSEADDPRYDAAALGLTALAYLFLVGALFAIRATGQRATFAVPMVFLASAAVAWRLLKLELPKTHVALYAGIVGLLLAQISWGLHYWPITPLRFALLLGLAGYLATGVTRAHLRGELGRASRVELSIVGAVALAAILALT
jgi:hypothetical protein